VIIKQQALHAVIAQFNNQLTEFDDSNILWALAHHLHLFYGVYKGASTLLVLVLVLARLVLIRRLVWLLLVFVNLRPYYFSCSPGFGG
jgi:hypothetical protein